VTIVHIYNINIYICTTRVPPLRLKGKKITAVYNKSPEGRKFDKINEIGPFDYAVFAENRTIDAILIIYKGRDWRLSLMDSLHNADNIMVTIIIINIIIIMRRRRGFCGDACLW